MARPTRFEHNQYVGDKRNRRVHDLDAATEACAIDELMASEQFAAFGPDSLAEARNRGYRPHPACTSAPAPAAEAPPAAAEAPPAAAEAPPARAAEPEPAPGAEAEPAPGAEAEPAPATEE